MSSATCSRCRSAAEKPVLLYVEPLYVQGTGQLLPAAAEGAGQLRREHRVPGHLGSRARGGVLRTVSPGNGNGDGGDGTKQPGTGDNEALTKALDQATKALADAQTALAKGDFKAYGEAQDRLRDAIEKAVAAQPSPAAPTPSGSPSTTATPTGSSTASPSG